MRKWIWIGLILGSFPAQAQLTDMKGLIPLQEMSYERSGIWGKELECRVGQDRWVSHRITPTQPMELILHEPRGLKTDPQGRVIPRFSALVTRPTGDTIGWYPSLAELKPIALYGGQLKTLSLSFQLGSLVRVGDSVHIQLGFHDSLSMKFFRVRFPVRVVTALGKTDFGNNLQTHSSTRGYRAVLEHMTCARFETYLDSGYFPNSLYHSVRAVQVEGIRLSELQAGRVSAWLYDEQLRSIPLPKSVKWYAALRETDKPEANLLVQVPLNPSDPKNRNYAIRVRWESKDGSQWMELINRF